MTPEPHVPLVRRLTPTDAVVVGLGAMLGAGVFVAFAPAAAVAGHLLWAALLLAAAVAWLNADSTARLAALLPTSGGAYTYGRARLGALWGGLAGWAFLVGKVFSAGAIAGVVGSYLVPAHARLAAVATIVVLTALACAGVRRSALVTRVVVAVVLVTLTAVVVGALILPGAGTSGPAALTLAAPAGALGVLQGAGILFFAFAGYARLATLGEEVVDPARTIPRAVAVALAVVLVVYGAVGWALTRTLGQDALAGSVRPVADAVQALGGQPWVPVVGAVAAAAAAASLLGVLLGLSRTSLAMARDGAIPRPLGTLDRRRLPVRAQVVVGAAAVAGVLLLDLPQAIAASSVCVLVYYAVAHLAALTLPGRARRVMPVLGLTGCLTVAVALLIR